MKLKLDSIILFVADVDKLASFYVGILGLEIVEDARPGWLLLEAGSCQLGLHKMGDQWLKDRNPQVKNETNTKMVFELDEDIFKTREWLVLQKVAMREIKSFEGYDFLLCDGKDPEGNVFQLKQRKASIKEGSHQGV
ncbi:MAG: VOC family protein [Chitinophagaceae bacterium]